MIDTTKPISKVVYEGTDIELISSKVRETTATSDTVLKDKKFVDSNNTIQTGTIETYDETIVIEPKTTEQVLNTQNKYVETNILVEAVTSSIDNNIVAENIKKDVEILGVTGTFSGSAEQPQLPAPEIFYIGEAIEISKSSEYQKSVEVYIDDVMVFICEEMQLDLQQFIQDEEYHEVYVKAMGINFNNSEPSNTIRFRRYMTPAPASDFIFLDSMVTRYVGRSDEPVVIPRSYSTEEVDVEYIGIKLNYARFFTETGYATNTLGYFASSITFSNSDRTIVRTFTLTQGSYYATIDLSEFSQDDCYLIEKIPSRRDRDGVNYCFQFLSNYPTYFNYPVFLNSISNPLYKLGPVNNTRELYSFIMNYYSYFYDGATFDRVIKETHFIDGDDFQIDTCRIDNDCIAGYIQLDNIVLSDGYANIAVHSRNINRLRFTYHASNLLFPYLDTKIFIPESCREIKLANSSLTDLFIPTDLEFINIKTPITNLKRIEVSQFNQYITSYGNYISDNTNNIIVGFGDIDSSEVMGIDNYAGGSISALNTPALVQIGARGLSESKINNLLLTSITSILDYGCSSCKSLTEVRLNNAINIGDYAFSNCYNLVSVTFGTQLTSLGNSTFSGCKALSSVNISSTKLTAIPENCFYGCLSLANITLPTTITSIKTNAFRNCFSLASITIPSSCASIGNYAFADCHSMSSVSIVSNGVNKTIGQYAFWNCFYLTTLTLTSATNITTISSDAFRGCKSLKTITIPNTVTLVGRNAFSGCTALETAYIQTVSSSEKASYSSYSWFLDCSVGLQIHASSTLTATTSKTAFGNYWNYRTSSVAYTVIYDL